MLGSGIMFLFIYLKRREVCVNIKTFGKEDGLFLFVVGQQEL